MESVSYIQLDTTTGSNAELPIENLLGTNTVPSQHQAHQIRGIIRENQRRLMSLEDQITTTQLDTALHGQLVREREEVQASDGAHRALLSLARHMPLEIWEEIFLHCLPEDTYIQPSPSEAPLLLCQICSSWRRSVLSMPRLWCSISTKVSTGGFCVPHVDLVKVWLSRSGTLPLFLSLSLDIPFWRKSPSFVANAYADMDLAFQAFVPYFALWRGIRMDLGPFSHSIQNIPRGSESLLESARFEAFDLKGDDESAIMTKIFVSSPRLRSLVWIVHTLDYLGQSLPLGIPMAQLTSLHLHHAFEMDGGLAVLRQCPKLVVLKLSRKLKRMGGSISPTAQPVFLRELKSLSIWVGYYLDLERFFDLLVSPALRDIDITAQCSRLSGRTFLLFLARSPCPLKSLRFGTRLSDEDLIQILQGTTTSLARLNICSQDIPCVTDHFLEALTVQATENACLCPYLEEVSFESACISPILTDGALAKMVESRWHSDSAAPASEIPVRLKRANIVIPEGHPNDFRRLKALHEQGLDIPLFADHKPI